MPQDNPSTDRFGMIFALGAIVAVLVLGGLIGAFVMGADGINQSQEDLARNRQERTATGAAPPANNVQTDPGGPSVRLVNAGAAIEIDFSTCNKGQQRFELTGGVTTYDFTGLDGSDCIVDYGDDASQQGTVTMACRVPASNGKVQFLIHDGRADMSGIADRCSKI